MSTEQKQLLSSRGSGAKKGNWFLDEDGMLKTWSWIALIILAIMGLVGLIRLGYLADWTGFQGKTLWDWMGLFIVSVALAAIGYGFTTRQAQQEHRPSILAWERCYPRIASLRIMPSPTRSLWKLVRQ